MHTFQQRPRAFLRSLESLEEYAEIVALLELEAEERERPTPPGGGA